MKKLSLVFILVALVAACLIGGAAFASSNVTTHADVYVGEYEHGHPDYPNDKEVVIVFGTADLAAAEEGTRFGIVVTKGEEKYYFPAKTIDQATGNFGVALIKSTILDGDFTAKAFSAVGGEFVDGKNGQLIGAVITEADTAIDLSVDNVQMSQSQTEITVTQDSPVNIADLITITGASKDSITYTVATEDSAQVDITDGVVSYKDGHGTATITAAHAVSGEQVSFTATVYQKEIEIKDKESFLSLAEYPNAYAYFTDDVEFWNADVAGKSSILGTAFKGKIDGNGYTLRYNRDYEQRSWYGVFASLESSSEVRNLVFELDAHVYNQYNSVLTNYARGLIENCYIRTYLAQTESNNYLSIQSLSRHQYGGTYKNVIIENLSTYPISINGDENAKLENVAWIAPELATNRIGAFEPGWSRYTNEMMDNLCYYTSFDNFLAGTGAVVSFDEETNAYVQTAFEATPQDLGSAWTFDAESGVSLNGKVVRLVTLPEVNYVITSTGSVVFTEAGQTKQLEMYYNEKYNEHFSFKSSNTAAITVDATSGLVTAVAPGTAIITATHRFTGSDTEIPVTFADAVFEINTAEELTSLTRSKVTELGASQAGTLYAYLGKDITLTEADMPYYVNDDSQNVYTLLPMGEYTEGNKTEASSASYMGVLDGKGHKITVAFDSQTRKDRYSGISAVIGSSTIIRNLVLEGTANTSIWSGIRMIADTNNGFIDNCFINTGFANVNMSSYNSTNFSKWIHSYGAPIGANTGVVRNSVIKNVWAERGNLRTGVLVANSSDGGDVENVAGINTSAAMMCRSGLTFSYAEKHDFSNLCYYATMSDFLSGNGKLFTRTAIDSTSKAQKSYNRTYYGTPLTEPQKLFGWTIDSEAKTIAMTVDGESKIVYTDTVSEITITPSATTMKVGDTITVTALEDGKVSDDVLLMVNNLSTKATCSQDGVVTAVAAGDITIVAYNPLTGVKATTATITITAE